MPTNADSNIIIGTVRMVVSYVEHGITIRNPLRYSLVQPCSTLYNLVSYDLCLDQASRN